MKVRNIDEEVTYAVSMRRYFHAHPEVSCHEDNTSAVIEKELDSFGIPHTRVDNHSIVGIVEGKKEGKTVLLRSDIDALPIQEVRDVPYRSQNEGTMHACGHDGHMGVMLGTAKYLSSHKEELKGKVLLVFQEGEEVGYGAAKVIAAGYTEGVDRAYAFHVCPELPCGTYGIVGGPIRSSVDYFKINVEGKASHIANPEKGIDAAYIASLIVSRAKALNELNAAPIDRCLLGIGHVWAGTAYNIVAEHAEIEGTIRVFSPEKRKSIRVDLENLAKQAADEVGGKVSFIWKDYTSPTVNDQMAAEEMQNAAKKLVSPDHVITDMKPELIGDDFGEFCLKVPGAYLLLGTADASREETCVPLHNHLFDIDENAIRYGIALFLQYLYE